MQNDRLGFLSEKVKKLPMQPGIYIMKDKKAQIIYIGKAKLLRNRVSSYFRSVEKHSPKVYKMVENVDDFDYIVTRSEFEALILECSFIKQYSPKYNILLKDDKGFHYIGISPGDYGRIRPTHTPVKDGSRYLGPYLSGYVVSQTVDEVNKAFLLPTCSRHFPAEIGKGRPCLNYHIKQCMAPCTGKISPEEYAEALEQAIEFLKGGSVKTKQSLEKKMETAAEDLEFEKAARYRDRLRAIEGIQANQKVVSIRYEEEDVVALVQGSVRCCAVVLQFRDFRLVDKEFFLLDTSEDTTDTRTQFLLRYYDRKAAIPKSVVLDGEIEHLEELQAYLSEKAGHSVSLLLPQKGDQKQLVEMAKENASQHLSEQSRRSSREIAALDELARLLGLHTVPEYIEAYDISNIGSETIVAGMVVFEGGRPLKGAYRKFAIQSVQGKADDYASMREVISRRLGEYERHKESGVGFGHLPDLILLDGGRGHVGTVKPVIAELGFHIPVFGMAKDERHRSKIIATEKGEISVTAFRLAFDLITSIQDEVHRFSISYSRSKHQSKSFALALQSVEGIGEKRAQNLFLRFRTVKAMQAATVEQLQETPAMNAAAALKLYRYLHSEASDLEETL